MVYGSLFISFNKYVYICKINATRTWHHMTWKSSSPIYLLANIQLWRVEAFFIRRIHSDLDSILYARIRYAVRWDGGIQYYVR
jgi:hypothetical protein